MALTVIGAGYSRTATFSLKFALEHLGFGPCHHFAEIFADVRRRLPLWLDAAAGRPDWDAIFDGFRSTVDAPACNYWRELAEVYPEARVILTVRDADAWFDSASETIYSDRLQASLAGSPMGELMQGAIFGVSSGPVTDRAHMTDWFRRRNQQVIDSLPPGRLLVFDPAEGWDRLCAFLGVPEPAVPFPRVNSRDELTEVSDENDGLPADPELSERVARDYIDRLRMKAFGTPA